MTCQKGFHSKYPPAEPDALGSEPLKAAGWFVAHANFPFAFCSCWLLLPNSHPLAADQPSDVGPTQLWHTSTFRRIKTMTHSLKCQTVTATPGGSPYFVLEREELRNLQFSPYWPENP
jgi:hypothetical protein